MGSGVFSGFTGRKAENVEPSTVRVHIHVQESLEERF